MTMRSGWVLVVMVAAFGCVHASPTRVAGRGAGRVECDPSLDCLPDPDVPPVALSRNLRFGQMLADGTLRAPPPLPPGETDDVQRWWAEVLEPWLAERLRGLTAAREELDRAAEEDHRQRIIGGAVVALMYEDLAQTITAIPAPVALRDEPEIREVYRSTLRGRARVFVEQARQAYSACAQNAVQPESMRHWSRFCAAREERLPEPTTPMLASGETVVEVIAE